jgi:glycosyltransferase involved in cell wall biosynthesis
MRVAIAHEWVTARAGSEQVFEAMAAALPEAELFALSADDAVNLDLGGRCLRTSPLDRLARHKPGAVLPLMPLAWRTMGASGPSYEMVVTSSHAFVRHFGGARHADVHLSYVHAPLRYAWHPELDNRLARHRVARPALPVLRRMDRSTVASVTGFAANSSAVRDRIRECYDADARVIHPPVETSFFTDVDLRLPYGIDRPGYLLSMSRLVPYKRHDLAISVAASLDHPLVIAGTGPDEARLRELADTVAPGLVTFLIGPSRFEVRRLYQHAAALLFLAVEDFGIVPVEAQAAGTPVVAIAEGGTLDSVKPGVTGELAPTQALADVARAARRVLDNTFAPADLQSWSHTFSAARFQQEFRSWLVDHGYPALPRRLAAVP